MSNLYGGNFFGTACTYEATVITTFVINMHYQAEQILEPLYRIDSRNVNWDLPHPQALSITNPSCIWTLDSNNRCINDNEDLIKCAANIFINSLLFWFFYE